jgi:chromate reductase
MSKTIKILGIAGSLRQASYNRAALRAAVSLVPAGATLETIEIGNLPLFSEDLEKPLPAVVATFKERIKAADAILFVTPEYNYSVPGVLKNAIDWGTRPYGENAWSGKPAAIMGASIGLFGSARAQYHLRQIMVNLNMYPINQPEVMIGQASQKFDQAGNLTDETTKKFIGQLLENLVKWTQRLA